MHQQIAFVDRSFKCGKFSAIRPKTRLSIKFPPSLPLARARRLKGFSRLGVFLLMNEFFKSRRFPVKCDDANRYDGRNVVFQVEEDGELRPHRGKFIIHQTDDGLFVDVEYWESHQILHSTPQGWTVHLSQAHVDSVVPVSDSRQEVEFAIQVPFLFRHCISNTSNHPPSP